MFCKHCGKEIESNSKFCMHCGGSISTALLQTTTAYTPPQTLNVNLSFGNKQTSNLNNKENDHSIKYDPNYIRDDSPVIIGIMSLLVVISFNTFIVKSYQSTGQSDVMQLAGNILIIIWRISASIMVTNIAKFRNRNPNWAWLAFFFPGITLIILGSMRKLIYPYDYNKMNNKLKCQINNNITDYHLKVKNYNLALLFSEKAVSLDPNNHIAYDNRGYAKYFRCNYSGALEDFNKSILLDSDFDHGIKYYHRGYAKKELGDLKGAFTDWNIASNKGNKDAQISIDKYCSQYKYSL